MPVRCRVSPLFGECDKFTSAVNKRLATRSYQSFSSVAQRELPSSVTSNVTRRSVLESLSLITTLQEYDIT